MQATRPPEELTLDNILTTFATDESARAFLETWLWPAGPVCPRCQGRDPIRVYRMMGKSARPGLHNCKDCRRQFTVTVGTIFEDSHIPIRKWIIAWYLLCASKKGVSSLQLQRTLGLGSYRTALFMTHRIRHALKDTVYPDKLGGTLEADETYVGGKARGKGRGYTGNKMPVFALLERDGRVRAQPIPMVTAKTLKAALLENAETTATLNTDQLPAYRQAGQSFAAHNVVNHSAGEYARGDATTNSAESFFALFKRGVHGTFHSISKQHLHLYLNEFSFRWDHRKVTDGERTVAALKKAPGKRLTYKAIKGA